MTLEQQAILSNYVELTALDSSSRVWLVRDVINSGIYVKKHIQCESPDVYRRLQAAHIAGIPEIYQVIEDDDRIIIIEEYIHGKTIELEILSENEVIKMAQQICSILETIHSMNPPIICRDIKPSNIMVQNGQYYLTDFNIARTYEPMQTTDTHLLGTANYAAPEQYGFGQTDARSDIYSLGVTINILLTGNFPQEKLAYGELGNVVAKATQMDPNNRYQSAGELSAALSAINASYPNSEAQKPRLKRVSTIVAIIFYTIWGSLIFTLFEYTNMDGTPATDITNFAVRLFVFAIVFLPYFYNANYFGCLDYTLASFKRGTFLYWLMRILYTILISFIFPLAIVLFFV